MLSTDRCIYQHGARILKTHKLIQNEVWDIEDLVKVGKRSKGCPYFASRAMAETAEIVFSPYNYLIEPTIRSAMELDLTGSIIIFDEAHNVESTSRDAGSLQISEQKLHDVNQELNNLIQAKMLTTECYLFQGILYFLLPRACDWL